MSTRLGERFAAAVGIQTGDNERFTRNFWELAAVQSPWVLMSRAPTAFSVVDGASKALLWENGAGQLHAYVGQRLGGSVGAWIRGEQNWNRPGILMSRMGGLPASVYPGGAYADNCMVITSDRDSESDLGALWELVRTGEVAQRIRAVDQSLNITPGSALAAKVQLASDHAPLPKPSSDEPTQWLFRGLVAGSRNPMQVAVARLLGFQWPDQEPDDVDGLADEDGIVCLPALGGEVTAEERLRTLMAKVYGTQWTHQLLESLLIDAGAKPGVGLEKWLRAAFFKDHCRVFSNRPFIWQVWDGRPDGFSALVNYHKLDRRLLESLTYNYLGNWWIGRQRDEVAGGAIGAEARLTAALELKQKLELILLGEPPYDIYVRWKSLEEQPMGWDPDLDDGVRLNIRPFMMASVLRAKPNIHWKKDRGKNPDGSDRHNDVHLTLAEKREARQAASRGRS